MTARAFVACRWVVEVVWEVIRHSREIQPERHDAACSGGRR
jgi:hypothetical protein